MKKYSIEEVCKELNISRQGLNARCRKLDIEKIKEGRRSYFTHKQIKILKGTGTTSEPEKDDTGGAEDSTANQKLLDRLINENDYLRKKLDEEGENLKGAMSVIIQHTERIKKLETENDKLLEYNGLTDIVENDEETEWKRKPQGNDTKWYQKLLKGMGRK
tara:strand:- start:3007 stop:3489 length:483 start_codon:yes stop_codon:yes gene_type:complete